MNWRLALIATLAAPLAAFLAVSINYLSGFSLFWFDQQRVGQGGLLLVMALVTATLLLFERPTRFALVFPAWPLLCAILAFFTLGALSAALAPSVLEAWLEWSRFTLLLVMAWLISNAARSHRAAVTAAIFAALLLAVVWFLAGRIGSYAAFILEQLPLSPEFFLNGFDNPRWFGHLQTLALPLLALPLLIPGVARRHRVLAAMLLVACWTLVWLSGTRGTWYALLVATVAAAIVLQGWGRRHAIVQLLASMTGALTWGFLFHVVPRWTGSSAGTLDPGRGLFSLARRDELWHIALGHVTEHPLLGIGPMMFALQDNGIGAHPHSLPLQLAAEWGLPAAALFLVTGAWLGIRHALRLRRRWAGGEDGATFAVDAALMVSITAIFVQSLVDGILVVPYTETLLAILAGLAWGRASTSEAAGRAHGTRRAMERALAAIILLGVSAVFAYGLRVQISALPGRIAAHEAQIWVIPRPIAPRFWAAGWLPAHPAARARDAQSD